MILLIAFVLVNAHRIHVLRSLVEMLNNFLAEMSVEGSIFMVVEVTPNIGNIVRDVELHHAISLPIDSVRHTHFYFVFLDFFVGA